MALLINSPERIKMDRMILKSALSELSRRSGLSLYAIAKRLEIPRSYIYKINNESSDYNIGKATERLAPALIEYNVWFLEGFTRDLERIAEIYRGYSRTEIRETELKDVRPKEIMLEVDLVMRVKPFGDTYKSIKFLRSRGPSRRSFGLSCSGYLPKAQRVSPEILAQTKESWVNFWYRVKIPAGTQVYHKVDENNLGHHIQVLKAKRTRKHWEGLWFYGKLDNPGAVGLPADTFKSVYGRPPVPEIDFRPLDDW